MMSVDAEWYEFNLKKCDNVTDFQLVLESAMEDVSLSDDDFLKVALYARRRFIGHKEQFVY